VVTFSGELIVEPVCSMGSDGSIVRAARVSTVGKNEPEAEAPGLIRFLMRNRHGTPFEHNAMTFYISAPIAVFREFHRHRIGWSYNEESGRYKQLEGKFYLPSQDRPLIQVGKPGAYEVVPTSDPDVYWGLVGTIKRSCEEAYKGYEWLLEIGVAKEVARGVLPVYTYTSMYATCNARSMMAFLSLRTKHEDSSYKSFPMWEIEQVALKLETYFASYFPITHKAFREFGSVSP
jgi:thymidylate synthase (FAD)